MSSPSVRRTVWQSLAGIAFIIAVHAWSSAPGPDSNVLFAEGQQCPAGTTLNSQGQCIDINECATNNGGCSTNATCTNVVGSYTCSCRAGFTGNGLTCVDINECATNNGGCSSSPFVTCTNTLGSRTCGSCPAGFTGNGITCQDINECATNNGGCSTNPMVQCTNTQGSNSCA